MKATRLKHDKPYHLTKNTFTKIISYTEGNNFPQICKQITTASVTASKCIELYSKFIYGLGIEENFIVNRHDNTLNDIISLIAKDLALFGGFSLHINTNLKGEVVEVQHIPFEFLRLSNEEKNKVWIYDRWENIYRPKISSFQMDAPEEFEFFKNGKTIYSDNGFVYYYSNKGFCNYPLPIYTPALTDMSTQEGVSNVLYRNARNNFFTSGFFINYNNSPESEEQQAEFENTISKFQQDENSMNIGVFTCESKEEKPEFIELKGTNLDGGFNSTLKICKENIGECFNIPPILRGEDVGSNFGSDAIVNAYNFYNLYTEPERNIIENTINYLYDTEFKIIKLKYLE